MLREDGRDEFFGERAILGPILLQSKGGGHKVGQLLGRIVTQIGHPLTGILGPAMGLDEFMVEKDLD